MANKFHYAEDLKALKKIIDEALEHGVPPTSEVKICVSNKKEGDREDFVGYVWSAVYDGKNLWLTSSDDSNRLESELSIEED